MNISFELRNLNKTNLIHAIKITLAAMISLLGATALGLDYTGSCAVIALITVAATKKETFLLSIRRLLTFFITLLLSFLLYRIIGIHYLSFAVLMLLLAFISYGLGMFGTISVNAVIATHVLSEQTLTMSFMINETLLVLIGTLTAVLLNLYMPDETKPLRQAVRQIEESERKVLLILRKSLAAPEAQSKLTAQISALKLMIEEALGKAVRNQENILAGHSAYYIRYMDMRLEQCRQLEQMADAAASLSAAPKQLAALQYLCQTIADTLHETNNGAFLLEELYHLEMIMKEEPLPVTREEFENRAILYNILLQLKRFLILKHEFTRALTDKQIEIYWNLKE